MDASAINELTSFPLVTFNKGEQLFDLSDDGIDVYYVVEGHCMRMTTTSAGEDIYFEDYSATSDVYALAGAFANYGTVTTSSASHMQAMSRVKAHHLTAAEFDDFLNRHPDILKELLARLTNEYRMLQNNFLGKQKGHDPARVASFILERARQSGDYYGCSGLYSVSNIARFLGMHRITVNKIVLAMRQAGVIDYSSAGITILDAERLLDYATGAETISYKNI